MNKYDIVSLDNRSQANGYCKIGTYQLQDKEKTNYNFSLNVSNLILDVYWFGNVGVGQYAKFGVALKNSTELNVRQLNLIQDGDIIENPVAYVRTEDGFDIYVRANSDISPYLNIKCVVTESYENRFIPFNGNLIVDISGLNAVYINASTLKIHKNTELKLPIINR